MTAREALHQLVDGLPEDRVSIAERALRGIHETADPVEWSLAHAPLDDEPDDDDLDGGLAEARASADRGEGVTTAGHSAEARRWGGWARF